MNEPQVLRLINPKDVNVLNSLGYTLTERTDRYQEAHHLLKQALDLQPENYYVLGSYGWVLYKMGNYTESIVYFQKAQAKQDASIPTETVIEVAAQFGVLWVSGDKEAAKAVWEKALKDFPNNEKLHDVMHRFVDTPASTSETPNP